MKLTLSTFLEVECPEDVLLTIFELLSTLEVLSPWVTYGPP